MNLCFGALDIRALQQLTGQFVNLVNRPCVLCLEGELGAGKTTFARHWIKEATGEIDVPSPTFSLVQEYRLKRHDFPLYHADLYRVEDKIALEEIGFPEMLTGGICLIEWASRIPDLFDAEDAVARLTLSIIDDNTRELHFQTQHLYWRDLMQQLDWGDDD